MVWKILNALALTHPMNVVRAGEIQRWVQAGAYDRILAGEYPRRGTGKPTTGRCRDDFKDAAEHYRGRDQGRGRAAEDRGEARRRARPRRVQRGPAEYGVKLLIVGAGGREHALARALSLDNPRHQPLRRPGQSRHRGARHQSRHPRRRHRRLWSRPRRSMTSTWSIVGPEAPLAHGLADRLRADGRVRVRSRRRRGEDRGLEGVRQGRDAAPPAFPPRRAPRSPNSPTRWRSSTRTPNRWWSRRRDWPPERAWWSAPPGPRRRRAVRAMLGETVLRRGRQRGGHRGCSWTARSCRCSPSPTAATCSCFPTAQDHKRLLEGDRGPNTGGMGAYAPVSLASPHLLDRVRREVLLPALEEMRRRGIDYRGVLYAGLMLASGRHAPCRGIQLPPGRPGNGGRAAAARERRDRALRRGGARRGPAGSPGARPAPR